MHEEFILVLEALDICEHPRMGFGSALREWPAAASGRGISGKRTRGGGAGAVFFLEDHARRVIPFVAHRALPNFLKILGASSLPSLP